MRDDKYSYGKLIAAPEYPRISYKVYTVYILLYTVYAVCQEGNHISRLGRLCLPRSRCSPQRYIIISLCKHGDNYIPLWLCLCAQKDGDQMVSVLPGVWYARTLIPIIITSSSSRLLRTVLSCLRLPELHSCQVS